MRTPLRLPAQRSVAIILSVYLFIIVLLVLWAIQLMGTVARQDQDRTPVLLAMSSVFPAALLLISGAGFSRVLRGRRAGLPGSRLRIRLIGSFALIVAVTALPMGLLTARFLRTAVGLWRNHAGEAAADAAASLAAGDQEAVLNRLGQVAASGFLDELLNGGDIGDIWHRLRDAVPVVEAIEVFDSNGARAMGDPELFFKEGEPGLSFSEGPLPPRMVGGRMVLSWRTTDAERVVVLSARAPDNLARDTAIVRIAMEKWFRIDPMSERLRGSMTLFGLFLSGPLVLLAFLTGMALSERIVRPLVALGDATGKISEGDFSFRVIAPREDELDFLTGSFNRMISELEVSRTKIVQSEKLAAWQVIAQKLAHELRNPLTPIKLSAQRVQRKVLEGSLDEDTLKKSVDLILREVDGLDRLLQDFRDFAGGGPPQLVRVVLGPLLSDAVERFRTVEPAIDWILVPVEAELAIPADPMQISQILNNLFRNAAEAGSTRVTVRADRVLKGTVPYVRLMVRDDGEGIDGERGVSIFQPYDSTRDRGSGLGLAVVQRIVYDHRGRIWYESGKGLGTVFYIDLPFMEAL